jgi:hypothetical protein
MPAAERTPGQHGAPECDRRCTGGAEKDGTLSALTRQRLGTGQRRPHKAARVFLAASGQLDLEAYWLALTAGVGRRHLGVKIEGYDFYEDGEVSPTSVSRRNPRRASVAKRGFAKSPAISPARHPEKRYQTNVSV